MSEIEKFVVAEKNGENRFVLEFNETVSDFIKILALTHGLTEKEIVETLFATGIGLAYREKEGKQLLVLDPNGPDKTVHVFKRNSS